MWDWFQYSLIQPIFRFLDWGLVFVFTNLTTIVGFVLAILIIQRVLSEKRDPSNFFAWAFMVVFVPIVGVPLYFMFGGRKSRRLIRLKREVNERAEAIIRNEPDGSPVVSRGYVGNRFELLPNGVAAFQRLCQEIDRAEHTIHIATYILGNDETGNAIVDRLAEKAKTGVTVRLLLDSLGSWNSTRGARIKIREAGGFVSMFMPVLPIQTQTSSNLRNHRKIAIFDNRIGITGGQNIDTRFMGDSDTDTQFADFSVVTQGPAVLMLTRTFIADWAFASGEPPSAFESLLCHIPEKAGDSTTEIIASGPDSKTDPLWEQVVRVIQEFSKSLIIVTPYFIPDVVIFRSLLVKARTGRNIQLILPLRSNQRLADIARHHYLRDLDEAGVKIFFYKPRMMHGKLILADGKIAMTGSANIDMRSLFVNFEIAQMHYNLSDVERLTEWKDQVLSQSIGYDEAKSDPNFTPHRFKEDLVSLLVPLL